MLTHSTKIGYSYASAILYRILFWIISGSKCGKFCRTRHLSPIQISLRDEANRLLEEAEVSYVYGGNRLGEGSQCDACNQCLSQHKPLPKQRLGTCPSCKDCSLDCSHFIHLVFRNCELVLPYLTTETMLQTTPITLRQSYHLIDLGARVEVATVGDLLVYKGHVVMLLETLGGAAAISFMQPGGKDSNCRVREFNASALCRYNRFVARCCASCDTRPWRDRAWALAGCGRLGSVKKTNCTAWPDKVDSLHGKYSFHASVPTNSKHRLACTRLSIALPCG